MTSLVRLAGLICLAGLAGLAFRAGAPAEEAPPSPASTPSIPSSTVPDSPLDALDRALEDAEAASPRDAERPGSSDIYSRQFGGFNLRFIDLSLDAMFAVGSSTEDDESLQSLQGGGHDPRKRGFTVQNVELSFLGAVDPYFTGEAHIIFNIDPYSGETVVELEEAFLTTLALPLGFQLEAGQFQTEFGRINPQHPHQWEWLDQPVVNSRFFGPDGMRNPGFRLGWLSPLPWFSELHVGMQNANGETMASFFSSDELAEERPIGGRPFVEGGVHTVKDFIYLLRWDNGFDLADSLSGKAGASVVYGPNSTGNDGYTRIYGADLLLKWRPLDNERGWPFVTWQTEVMRRDYHADDALDPGEDPDDPADDIFFPADTLGDWGLYTQVLWGFRRNWALGLRYEHATVVGSQDDETRNDPFRDRRHRIAPLLVWQPTEFSRLRLQYNYDRAQHIESGDAHSVWLGAEIMFGAHAAHGY